MGSKDKRTSGIVSREIGILKKNGDDLSTVCEIDESPIDSFYFYRRIGSPMTSEISKKIYKSLKQNGFLNDKDLLIQDPRRSNWRNFVQESVTGIDTLVGDKSAISEEMNVAFAMHELAASCKPEMIKFIKSIEQNNA